MSKLIFDGNSSWYISPDSQYGLSTYPIKKLTTDNFSFIVKVKIDWTKLDGSEEKNQYGVVTINGMHMGINVYKGPNSECYIRGKIWTEDDHGNNKEFENIIFGKYNLTKAVLIGPPQYMPEGWQGSKIVITNIFVIHTKLTKNSPVFVWLYVKDYKLVNSISNRTIWRLQQALSVGEVINPKASMTRGQAITKLKEQKDLFDLGVGGYKEWLGSDNKAKFRKCNLENVVTNFCRKSDFSDLIHAGEIIDVPLVELATVTDKDGNKMFTEKQLQEFASTTDNLEEVFENREQIEISKHYEKMPKPTAIATQELLDDKIYMRKPEEKE